MTPDAKDDAGWHWLVKRLPRADALDASAHQAGALVRRREVRDGKSLLRLILAYGPGGLSLRETSAWAAERGLAQMSDVAVLKRLRGAAGWLAGLLGDMLAKRAALARELVPAGRWVRLIDGTMITGPGKQGGQWRLHLTYDLSRQHLEHVELTDQHGAEKLERAPVEPGEIRIADRCYARPDGLRHMLAGAGDFIVRVGVRSLKLLHPDRRPFSLQAFLRRAGREGLAEATVLVGHGRRGKSWKPVPVRLIAQRKPPQAAASSRRAARRASQRQGDRIARPTLAAANYLILVTSLDAVLFPAALVIALYRLRWQIELLCKRLKSLLHIDRLPAKDANLARCWLYAHLLLACLLEDFNQEFLESPPSGPPNASAPALVLARRQTLSALPPRRHPRSSPAPKPPAKRRSPRPSSLRSTTLP